MNFVSLRGNLNGRDLENENRPYIVSERLKEGYWCWVDVWWKEDGFYLGTEEPKWLVKPSFVKIYSLLANAKNFTTLLKLYDIGCPHIFMYEDKPVLTDFGKIVSDTYIDGYEPNTILLTDDVIYRESSLYGIVSDYIFDFKS